MSRLVDWMPAGLYQFQARRSRCDSGNDDHLGGAKK